MGDDGSEGHLAPRCRRPVHPNRILTFGRFSAIPLHTQPNARTSLLKKTELPRLIKEKSVLSHNHIKNMIYKIYSVRFSG